MTTNELNLLKIVAKEGKLHSFYHTRSLGDIQLMQGVRKRIQVAFRNSGIVSDFPKTFYFVEQDGEARFFPDMLSIIEEYAREALE